MTYTPSPIRSKISPNNFSGVRTDGNRVALTGYANTFQTQDATLSPVVSPVTVNTQTTLTVPTNAVQCTIVSTTNIVQVSEDSTQGEYFTLPASVLWTFNCANQKFIYLKTASSTVVNFYFDIV
jgi:hypothetical protein